MIVMLPYPPSANASWRSGVSTLGKPFVYCSKQYGRWRKEAAAMIMQQKSQGKIQKVNGPYMLEATFDESRRRWNTDLDNRIKVVNDALQAFGVIENDRHCEDIKLTWGKVEGCCVRVFPKNGAAQWTHEQK